MSELRESGSRLQSDSRPSASVFMPTQAGKLTPVSDCEDGSEATFSQPEQAAVHAALRAFIGSGEYPCVGAKSALKLGAYRVGLYDRLSSTAATDRDSSCPIAHLSKKNSPKNGGAPI